MNAQTPPVTVPQADPGASYRALKEPIDEGRTLVRAIVVEVSKDRFVARILGHDVTPRPSEGSLSKVAVG